METMAQELNINNHTLRSVKKMFCDFGNTNIFYNTYTLMDIQEAKNQVYLALLRKYNYLNKDIIRNFVDQSCNMLSEELFSSNETVKNTEMIGVKDIIKDPRRLNKNYFNEVYRIVSIDSLYRDNLLHTNDTYNSRTSSSMSVTLNDKLDNVVSLELTNINIPFTFYNIDENNGNNYFYVEKGSNLSKVTISSGNYTNSTLITAINSALGNAIPAISNLTFSLNATTNKVTIENTDAEAQNVIFYDHLDVSQNFYNNNTDELSADIQAKLNNNLGWILGFRNINKTTISLEYNIATNTTITGESLCYIPYTKYFIVILDDRNKNQTNKSLVQISSEKEFIKPTQYFKEIDNSLNCLTESNCSTYAGYENTQLTQKQLYSRLQINNHKTNFKNKNSMLDAVGINNVFGIIPFEQKSLVWGESMFTSDKNRFKRKYNGPIDITKMEIKLLDDRGNLLNLNGAEWSMTMISTHLYQY